MIVIHTHDVMNDPSFMNIEVDTLMDILDQEELSIESELDLFNILVYFAEKRGDERVRAITATQSKEMVNVGDGEQHFSKKDDKVEVKHFLVNDDSNDRPSGKDNNNSINSNSYAYYKCISIN